jgi:hypothetical protein
MKVANQDQSLAEYTDWIEEVIRCFEHLSFFPAEFFPIVDCVVNDSGISQTSPKHYIFIYCIEEPVEYRQEEKKKDVITGGNRVRGWSRKVTASHVQTIRPKKKPTFTQNQMIDLRRLCIAQKLSVLRDYSSDYFKEWIQFELFYYLVFIFFIFLFH